MRLRTGPELAAGGDAIARAPDGRVVFVVGAVPDEELDVEITEDNRSFLRARVAMVVTPGPARVAPPCRHFGRCGGCTLMHVTPSAQTRAKHQSVLVTLARIGKIDVSRVVVAEPWSGEPEGYRARARFAISADRRVGFRAQKQREVVDVAECLVASPLLSRALTRLREAVAELPKHVRLPKEAEVEAVASDHEALVALPKGLEALRDTFRDDDVVRLARDATDAIVVEDDERGPMLLAPSVFAQSNAAGNRAMVDEVEAQVIELSRAPDGTRRSLTSIVELYSGSGNFTRRLAFLADRVRAFESSTEATALARRAVPESVELGAASAEDALGRLVASRTAVDVLVVDPPRIGLSAEVIDGIVALEPRAIVYVSCDPATFARDVGRIQAKSPLALDHLRVFDLYPHTAHVEVIGRLRRAP